MDFRGRLAPILLSIGCLDQSTPDPPIPTCDDGLIEYPTREGAFSTSDRIFAFGGIAASESCDTPDRVIGVSTTNQTNGQTDSADVTVRCEQICPFSGCTGKFYYWNSGLALDPGRNHIVARSSLGKCDLLDVIYTPQPPDGPVPVDAAVDAAPPLIQITSPSTDHRFATSANFLNVSGVCAIAPDQQRASVTFDTSPARVDFYADTSWSTGGFCCLLQPGLNRVTVSATFSGLSASDYIDVTYSPPDAGTD